MVNHSCLSFKNPPPWIVFLAPPFIIVMGFLGSAGYLFSIFLTSTVLILSTTVFLAWFSKQKSVDLVENPYEGNVEQEDESKPHHENENENETKIEAHHDQEGNNTITNTNTNNSSSSALLSESDDQCLGDQVSSSGDSEVNWGFGDYSDGSISDEDSLIEIELPSGQYVGHHDDGLHYKREHTFRTTTLHHIVPASDSIFKQASLMELLALEINDMNEEDNLIEIDISMGSIKCSRFEIEA